MSRFNKLETLRLDTDFLIVGGGLAGCSAAIAAREMGLNVIIMEKAHIDTSGQVLGLDHQPVQHPLLVGENASESFHKFAMDEWPGLKDKRYLDITFANNLRALYLMEKQGVKLAEDDGMFKLIQMVNHRKPMPAPNGSMRGDTIFYRGSDLKLCLAKGAKKSGARILNRAMLTSVLVKDGKAVGATGVDIRTGRYIVIRAKSVLLATGTANRTHTCPSAPFPNDLFMNMNYDGNCGEGIVAAYKAGARISNMEFVTIFPVAAGKGVGHPMYAQLKNDKGDVMKQKYPRCFRPPKGHLAPFSLPLIPPMPMEELDTELIFGDSSDFDDNDIRMFYFSACAEKPHMVKVHSMRGDAKTARRIEIRPQILGLINSGCICEGDQGQTCVENLYTAGELNVDTGGGASNSVIWGDIIGRHVGETAKQMEMPQFTADVMAMIEADREKTYAPLNVEDGINPLELEHYIRTTNDNFVGIRKHDIKLRRALEQFDYVEEAFISKLGAATPHELMRALEVKAILEISKLHAEASLLRTESRISPSHYRVDYPEQDDANWQKAIVFKKVNGEKVIEYVAR